MSCLIEFFGEIFLEIYFEMAASLVPEGKLSSKLTIVLKAIAGIVALALLAMLVVGIGLIIDGGDHLGIGIWLTVLSVLIPVVLIILAAVIHQKRDQ